MVAGGSGSRAKLAGLAGPGRQPGLEEDPVCLAPPRRTGNRWGRRLVDAPLCSVREMTSHVIIRTVRASDADGLVPLYAALSHPSTAVADRPSLRRPRRGGGRHRGPGHGRAGRAPHRRRTGPLPAPSRPPGWRRRPTVRSHPQWSIPRRPLGEPPATTTAYRSSVRTAAVLVRLRVRPDRTVAPDSPDTPQRRSGSSASTRALTDSRGPRANRRDHILAAVTRIRAIAQ